MRTAWAFLVAAAMLVGCAGAVEDPVEQDDAGGDARTLAPSTGKPSMCEGDDGALVDCRALDAGRD